MNDDKSWHSVILYNKAGCHLCEVAKAALVSLDTEFDVVLEEVDITSDPALYEKYKYSIPVMVVDAKIELKLRITAKKLRRALAEGYGPRVR
jgi:glutaredoxin